MTAWEYPFQQILTNVRKEETDLIRSFRTLQVSSINLGRSSPALAACFTIITLVAINESDVTAANLFVAMSAFLALRLPLIGIPTQSVLLANTIVSFNRIGSYLLLEDSRKIQTLPDNGEYAIVLENAKLSYGAPQASQSKKENTDDSDASESAPSSDESSVKINVNPYSFQLTNINMKVPRKRMVAVVGRVASGKSSLLNSIIGSLHCVEGSIRVREKIAFVPQKPFVLSGMLRENITMGKEFDQTKYDRAVKTADLGIDFQNMKYGDKTEIGERGQTVSGGQQQRLAIARAIYSDPHVLIMDDPLSAVDTQVAQTIFKNLKSRFKDENLDCSLLMSLNQYHFLPEFDYIYVLKNGTIVEEGTYNKLVSDDDSLLKAMVSATDNTSMDHQESKTEVAEKDEEIVSGSDVDMMDISLKDVKIEDIEPTENEIVNKAENVDQNHAKKQAKIMHQDEEDGNKLVKKDFASKGAVAAVILKNYLGAMGRFSIPISFLLGALAYGILAFNDAFIYASLPEQTEAATMQKLAFIYMGLSLAHVLGVQALSLHNCHASVRASRSLHDECINYLLHAPITWFEANPSGRILSRFSGDLSNVDRQLAFIFDDCFQFFFMLLALSGVVIVIIPYLLPALLFGAILFGFEVVALDRSNREVKRYTNQALAPVLTNISETVSARGLIQAMNLGPFFSARQEVFVDRFVQNQYFSGTLINWSIMMTGLISFLLALPTSMTVIFLRDTIDASKAGLALTYAFLIPYFLGILAIVLPIGFAALTSLERVLEYHQLPQEPNWHEDLDKVLCPQLTGSGRRRSTVPKQAIMSWPSKGEIVFEEASLVYREGLPPAIDRLSVRFEGGKKIGVVGRTGAGKSSLTLLLFRVYEASTGRVLIDGQDISKVGLQLLRRSIASIPQHPLLLRGSIRKNLDPFGLYSTEKLKKVMLKVGLDLSLLDESKNDEKNNDKDGHDETGSQASDTTSAFTLSIGQRQLISLARVLLRDNLKIVIMDEPTSNIDQETDQNIQRAVRTELASSTVITIAHRLGTIIDCDKILVLEKGEIIEYDSGAVLLQNKDSHLYGIVESMGKETAASLLHKAKSVCTLPQQRN
uniref:ATP-dependent transporter ycf16 n=1 Tax=Aplanochytrium stocchinoi TaxID=215587 RepID=A0A7S3LJ39_9STRA